MLVKDLLLTEPVVCLIDDYLPKTVQLISEHDLVCLPVVESLAHKNVIGVITEKDICRQAIAVGLDPRKTSVGRIMNNRFFTVKPETAIDECWRLMLKNKVDYLFVTNSDNSCSGIVTRDLLPEKELLFDVLNVPKIAVHHAGADRIF